MVKKKTQIAPKRVVKKAPAKDCGPVPTSPASPASPASPTPEVKDVEKPEDSQDSCQKRTVVLEKITSLHDELDNKINGLYDRLVAATTISNELKSIMMLELENLIRSKNIVSGVRSAVLSRICAEVLDKEDAEKIGKIFMDFANTPKAQTDLLKKTHTAFTPAPTPQKQ